MSESKSGQSLKRGYLGNIVAAAETFCPFLLRGEKFVVCSPQRRLSSVRPSIEQAGLKW